MDQEKFEIWMMEYLSGELEENQKLEFENYLDGNPDHKEEFDKLKSTWSEIDSFSIPEPSEEMDVAFFDMLNAELESKKEKKQSWFNALQSVFSTIQKPQLAFGTALLLIGLVIGRFMNSTSPTKDAIEHTVVSNSETEEVRGQLVLTLLEQPSANKRLQGVNEANKIEKVDNKVIAALLKTLNGDPNVNVRLAAIESLVNYVDNPVVREGLVQSIVHQESPIVQVTLADLMVALQEKKSIESFKTLIRDKELDSSVKQKLESSIDEII